MDNFYVAEDSSIKLADVIVPYIVYNHEENYETYTSGWPFIVAREL